MCEKKFSEEKERMLKMPKIKESPSLKALRKKNQEIIRKYSNYIK